MKTGNTRRVPTDRAASHPASMEPGHEDREYADRWASANRCQCASMEPGHEDREYPERVSGRSRSNRPQWSPVMKTGNTWPCANPSWGPGTRLNGARS